MASRGEVLAVYSAGAVQGVALVTFPAASTILTSPNYYDLTDSQYGGLFVPQALTAVVAALLGASLARRFDRKRILLAGLAADLASMALLLLSRQVMDTQALAYVLLLIATASLGTGFGLTVPAINSYAADFFPTAIDRAVLYLNALLGLGTVMAPVFVAVFVSLGFWQGLPWLVAVMLVALTVFSVRLPLSAAVPQAPAAVVAERAGRPSRLWVFAAFALLYGIVETMNGNWASLYMTRDMQAGTTQASIALTAFWAMVTVGRVTSALIERWVPERETYHALTFVVALAFIVLSLLSAGSTTSAILTFGLAGLGCSALLPLTISFGQADMPVIASSVAASLIAAYQVGYGLAAFGAGPLQSATGLGLGQLYGWSAMIALVLAAFSFAVSKGHAAQPEGAGEPRSHPR